MHRSQLIAAASLAATMAFAPPAFAQEKVLYVAGYGGSFEKTMRDEVIPQFEKEHGVKVQYVAGNSTDTLAKLQAQKGNQQIDVAIVDDGPMYQAIELGFCGRIADLPAADLYDAARFKDDRAVAIGLVATGLVYNKDLFAEKGWSAPASWDDLKDPKFKNLIVIPPINNTYGLYTLLMFARMNGGGEDDIEPGFKAMKEVNANVLAYEPSPGKMTELFQSGQAALAVWGTGRAQSFANTGFPVDFVYPKEGAVTLLASACPIEKPGVSPLASAFVKALLKPELQLVLLRDYGYGPVNRNVEVPAELGRMAPIGERVKALYNPDWARINPKREEWTKRWNREVER
ncbi:putative spermidine/putrescine transport system substrate-binding protein [Chelatococcus caeni]|uniref:Putative spermidine/putrescine transport system substrate-binding protein n=1 Tax=Chelatococcus caeni TaxID=1348468 RepID=A0A840C4Z7_9HYPH|nr:ABC transporter substrate-binding protein [Chelatococcus caeni]MBB4017477.1 putative spermidine/putrescine transport system substrate-binding protein [Chelatococcus caeni]